MDIQFLLTVLAFFVVPTTVLGVPIGGQSQQQTAPIYQSELIQSTMQAAGTALIAAAQEELFCNYMNSTMARLVGEGKLQIPDFNYREGYFIFMSVADTPASISDLLPSQRDQEDSSLDHQLLQNLQLDTITYNCDSNSLTLLSRPYSAQTIIPGIMEFRNMRFILSTGTQQEILVEFSGDWNIGSLSLNIELDLSFENDSMMVSADISSDSGFDFRQLVQDLTDTQLPPIVSGTFQRVRVEADSGTGVVVVNAQFGTNSKAYLIIRAYRDEESTTGFQISGAVAVEFSSIRLSNLIQQVFEQDISRIPYFRSLTLPGAALIISEDTINRDSITRAFRDCPLLSNNGGEIQAGTVTYLQVGFTTSDLQLIYNEGNLEFSLSREVQLSLQDLLSVLPGVNLQNLDLPAGVNNILDLTITSFLIDVNSRVLSVEVVLPMMLTYFDDILSITDTAAVITVNFMDNTFTVAVNGELTIASTTLDVTIAQDNMEQYVLQASTERLHITNIVQQFGAEVLPSQLNSISTNIPFLNFVIESPQVTLRLMSSPLQVHISGRPIVNGYNIGPTALTIIKNLNRVYLVQGLKLQSVNFADLLGSITPTFSALLRAIIFLDQDINTALLISPEYLPDVALSSVEFSDFVIGRGLSIKATIPIPSTCSLDPFCAVYRFLLGEGYTITLQGTIVNPSLYSLIARIDDITIGSRLTITDAGVEVRVGATTDIGITGTIALNNPELIFTCRIAIRQPTAQVALEMTMSGCWQNPFGLPHVAICNLLSSIAIQPGVTVPTGLAFGGELRIGDEQCGRVITAVGFIGLDTVAPQENYFHADVQGAVTIPSLLEAFCVTGVNLPRPLASSGFPNGFLMSFASIENVLPHVQLTIHQGFRFNGTINILGLNVHAEIGVELPDGFSMRAALPQIDIGNGLLVMTRSSSQLGQSEGPIFLADIDLLPQHSVSVVAQGHFSVLGISVQTNLSITNNGYSLQFEGRMLNLFQAILTVSAPYGSIISASYRVRGTFRSDLYSAIENSISNVVQTVSDEAIRIVNGQQLDLDNARQISEEANRALDAAQGEFDRAQGAFDNAVREVDRLSREVDNICHIRGCGSVCIGCFRGTNCCGRLFGHCVCVEPRWEGCCHRVTDPVCEAANTACHVLREPIRALLTAARTIVDNSRHGLDVAREGLRLSREAANRAEQSADLANTALTAARDTYQVGLQVAGLITNLGVGANQIVSVKEISFDVPLEYANTGRFNCNVRCCIAGNEVNTNTNINLYDTTEIARILSDRVVNGLSGFF